MHDLTLVLDSKKSVVRMEPYVIRVDRPGREPQKVPINMIARVIVNGAPMVASNVWCALARKNIPAVIVPYRGKGSPAYLGAGLSSSVERRMAQYLAIQNGECAMEIGIRLIELKLKGQASNLEDLGQNHAEITKHIFKIKEIREDLKNAFDPNMLMGLEGSAAREYFKGLSLLLPKEWKFRDRNRQPPRDPLNSLLSLGYVIAGGDVRMAITEKGLDPVPGFIHATQGGRESLTLDILEPIRPIIDLFAISLLGNPLRIEEFKITKQDGCRLSKEGRRLFYQHWASFSQGQEDSKGLKAIAREIIDEVIEFLS